MTESGVWLELGFLFYMALAACDRLIGRARFFTVQQQRQVQHVLWVVAGGFYV